VYIYVCRPHLTIVHTHVGLMGYLWLYSTGVVLAVACWLLAAVTRMTEESHRHGHTQKGSL